MEVLLYGLVDAIRIRGRTLDLAKRRQVLANQQDHDREEERGNCRHGITASEVQRIDVVGSEERDGREHGACEQGNPLRARARAGRHAIIPSYPISPAMAGSGFPLNVMVGGCGGGGCCQFGMTCELVLMEMSTCAGAAIGAPLSGAPIL